MADPTYKSRLTPPLKMGVRGIEMFFVFDV
jgi:hypothetical protein